MKCGKTRTQKLHSKLNQDTFSVSFLKPFLIVLTEDLRLTIKYYKVCLTLDGKFLVLVEIVTVVFTVVCGTIEDVNVLGKASLIISLYFSGSLEYSKNVNLENSS